MKTEESEVTLLSLRYDGKVGTLSTDSAEVATGLLYEGLVNGVDNSLAAAVIVCAVELMKRIHPEVYQQYMSDLKETIDIITNDDTINLN